MFVYRQRKTILKYIEKSIFVKTRRIQYNLYMQQKEFVSWATAHFCLKGKLWTQKLLNNYQNN